MIIDSTGRFIRDVEFRAWSDEARRASAEARKKSVEAHRATEKAAGSDSGRASMTDQTAMQAHYAMDSRDHEEVAVQHERHADAHMKASSEATTDHDNKLAKLHDNAAGLHAEAAVAHRAAASKKVAA